MDKYNKGKIIMMVIMCVATMISIASNFFEIFIAEDFIFIAIPFLCIKLFGTIIILILAMKDFMSNNKRTFIGVLLCLFCSIVAGIIYLMWQPQQEKQVSNEYKPDFSDDEDRFKLDENDYK